MIYGKVNNNRGNNYEVLADGRTDRVASFDNANTNAATVAFKYEYDNWDDYKQKTITVTGIGGGVKGWRDGMSEFTYDVNGHVKQLYDHAEDRTIQYVNNHNGQTLQRVEFTGRSTTTSKPTVLRRFYYLYGRVVGDQGMDKVPSRVDYAQTLRGSELEGNGNKSYIKSKRTESMSALWQRIQNGEQVSNDEARRVFRNKVAPFQHHDIGERVSAVTSADFDQNFQPINEGYPTQSPATYVVRQGDTLQSIAVAQWGDGSLWYIIAEANGLKGNETLTTDLRLTIPNVVSNIHNNATTFRPIDPALTLGDTSPTLPAPPPPPKPKKKGCGVLGLIIVVVVAIVVTIFTAGAAAGGSAALVATAGGGTAAAGSTFAAGLAALSGGLASTGLAIGAAALGAAAGSIVSQGVGIAIGAQEKFSFKAVAAAALSAVVPGFSVGTGAGAQIANAAIDNVVSQGLNIAIGLQKKFDWRSVAASAVGATTKGLSGAAARRVTALTESQFAGQYAGQFIQGLASDAAYGALAGRKTNFKRLAVDTFGSTLRAYLGGETKRTIDLSRFVPGAGVGNALGDSITDAFSPTPGGQATAKQAAEGSADGRELEEVRVTVKKRGPSANGETERAAVNAEVRGVAGVDARQLLAADGLGLVQAVAAGDAVADPRRYIEVDGKKIEEVVVTAQQDLSGIEEVVVTAKRDSATSYSTKAAQDQQSFRNSFLSTKQLALRERVNSLFPPESRNYFRAFDTADVAQLALGKAGVIPLDKTSTPDYKRQFISHYRDVFIQAATDYDLPPELLAGVAYREVGGNPVGEKDSAYFARIIENRLGFGTDANKTSFGALAIQVRRAGDSLGYSAADLDLSTQAGRIRSSEIRNDLRDDYSDIFIVASHLSDLRDLSAPGGTAKTLTSEDISLIGARYNRGPDVPRERLTPDDTNPNNRAAYRYGRHIVDGRDEVAGYLGIKAP